MFMKLLNNLDQPETNHGYHETNDDGPPGIMCHNRTRHSNVNRMRNATIQAMSNLLSANIDSGLMHSICLGYDKDFQTRAAFMEVLTKILQQGTEFDTLAETVLADRFEQLVQLVTMIGDKGKIDTARKVQVVNAELISQESCQ